MLKIKFREPEPIHPLQEICPWIDFLTPGLVLNKDGSLLAAFEFEGLDPDDVYDEKIDFATEQLQNALSLFDKRLTGWWIIDKRRDYAYPTNTFDNDTARELDEIYSAGFRSGHNFSIRYNFFLLFTGNTGTDKIMDRVARIQRESDVSILSALVSAMKEAFVGRNAFMRDIAMLRDMVAEFERIISGFVNAAPVRFHRLQNDDFAATLATILNRASPPARHRKPDFAMLDAWAPTDYVTCGPDLIQFQGTNRTVYSAVLGVVKWPEETTPQLFENLLKIDAEITVCQIIRFLNNPESTAEIQKAIEFYTLSKFGWFSHAMAKLTGATPEARQDKVELLERCQLAANRVGVDGVNFAMMALSVFAYGRNQQELNRNVSLVSQRLSLARFGVIRERLNALPSFCAMLPGQWALQSRYDLVSLENVSDMAPIYTVSEGSRIHEFFSNDVYHKQVPNFAVFGNSYGGKFYFSPHVGQVGHMVVIAPTGGGKTTFVNFCMSQFQRYGKVNTFVFDRNYSCQIVTELHNGTHIDIKDSAKLNPFFAMKDGSADGKHWVREFILRRLSEGGYRATAEDRQDIDRAIESMNQGTTDLRMSRLATLLPKHLENELGEWLEGRPYGMFDHTEDDFELSQWTTIEMLDIMSTERLARAFMDYAFRKIFMSLDGTPTFIYLEEASFLLNNPMFRDMIDDWLKTFRKKNAFVWMTIQSPESITSQEISASILDNVFSFLLMPNDRVEAHREAYKKSFGLHDHQIDLIKKLQPKRDYLLVQGGQAHILRARFAPEVLAYIRSEATVLNTYRKFRQSGAPDWKRRYITYLQKA